MGGGKWGLAIPSPLPYLLYMAVTDEPAEPDRDQAPRAAMATSSSRRRQLSTPSTPSIRSLPRLRPAPRSGPGRRRGLDGGLCPVKEGIWGAG